MDPLASSSQATVSNPHGSCAAATSRKYHKQHERYILLHCQRQFSPCGTTRTRVSIVIIDDAARRWTGALASRPRCASQISDRSTGTVYVHAQHAPPPKASGRATRPRRGPLPARLGRRRPLQGIPICRRGIAPSFRASRVDLRVSDLSEAHWQARGPSSSSFPPDRDRDEETRMGPPLRRGGPRHGTRPLPVAGQF